MPGGLAEVDVYIEIFIIDEQLARTEVEDRRISRRSAYMPYRGLFGTVLYASCTPTRYYRA